MDFLTQASSRIFLRLWLIEYTLKQLSVNTLHELQVVPSRVGDRSVFGLFSQVKTYGGRDFLEQWFTSPCASVEEIVRRQQLLQFVAENHERLTIDVRHAYLVAAENHLLSNLTWSSAKSWLRRYREARWFAWRHPHDFNRLRSGTAAVQLVLRSIEQKTAWLRAAKQLPAELQQYADTLRNFFEYPLVRQALTHSTRLAAITKADYLLRSQFVEQVRAVLRVFYQLDAYLAIAHFTLANGWVYPTMVESEQAIFQVDELVHPLLEKSVHNEIAVSSPGLLVLLTGGNMSGKTTFLKACGIAVYLAHLGLAVPAKRLCISFFDNLTTSIHLSDNLELGYSHFYSELMQIKSVAEQITQGERVFFIADELFRGTNPRDALSCSHRVIDKLIQQCGSLFMVSSHLPEIGQPYQTDSRVLFYCFRTQVIAGKLTFTHAIETGVAEENTGLHLLNQTNILEGL